MLNDKEYSACWYLSDALACNPTTFKSKINIARTVPRSLSDEMTALLNSIEKAFTSDSTLKSVIERLVNSTEVNDRLFGNMLKTSAQRLT